MFACIHGQSLPLTPSLAEFAYAFSPLLEETAADTVVLDVDGCELLFGSAYELAKDIVDCARKPTEAGGLGSKVNVALAANPDAAIYAARFFEGITYIAPGEEHTALGQLSIEALCFQRPMFNVQCPMSEEKNSVSTRQTLDIGRWTLDDHKSQEILETLRLWGVRTFGDLAALPAMGVAARLGQEGVRLQQLATGQTERHLNLRQPAQVFENSIELEHALAELEPLSFIFARLLNQLCAKLSAYALATNEIKVRMKLEDQSVHERKINLPYAMRDHKVLLKLLLFDTEKHPPASPVVGVNIACEPVKPRVLQNGLFVPLVPQPEKLELTLARLEKLVGTDNVGSPEVLDTHRPDAFRIKKFILSEREKRRRIRPQSAIRNGNLEIRNSKFEISNLRSEISGRRSVGGFRVFRPPLRAVVEASRGYPTQVTAWGTNQTIQGNQTVHGNQTAHGNQSAQGNQSVHGKVVRLGGPWRTTGDWWRADAWARDEWDVAIENRSRMASSSVGLPSVAAMNGASLQILCRIYRDLNSNSWFVEGIYD